MTMMKVNLALGMITENKVHHELTFLTVVKMFECNNFKVKKHTKKCFLS